MCRRVRAPTTRDLMTLVKWQPLLDVGLEALSSHLFCILLRVLICVLILLVLSCSLSRSLSLALSLLSAAGVAASFGEMLLLVAMYFHSNQLSSIIELVCSTLGMKVWQ